MAPAAPMPCERGRNRRNRSTARRGGEKVDGGEGINGWAWRCLGHAHLNPPRSIGRGQAAILPAMAVVTEGGKLLAVESRFCWKESTLRGHHGYDGPQEGGPPSSSP